jgi:predicted transcriptional regulator
VTSYSLPLREIDTVQGDDGPDGGYVPNALEVVVRKTHLAMLEVRDMCVRKRLQKCEGDDKCERVSV